MAGTQACLNNINEKLFFQTNIRRAAIQSPTEGAVVGQGEAGVKNYVKYIFSF